MMKKFKELSFSEKTVVVLWTIAFSVFVGGKKPFNLVIWVAIPFIIAIDFIQQARVWNNYDFYFFITILLSIPYYFLLSLIVKS